MALIVVFILAGLSLALGLAVLVFLFQGAVFGRFEGLLKQTSPFLVFITGLFAAGLPVLAGILAIRSPDIGAAITGAIGRPVDGIHLFEIWGIRGVEAYAAAISVLTGMIYTRRGLSFITPFLSKDARAAHKAKVQSETMRKSKKMFGEDGVAGQKSESTEFIELTYNKAGELIDCEILDGRFEGEDVDDLSIFELLSLWFEIFEHDIESARKLEKYLDFAMPDWRSFFLKMAKAAHGPETGEQHSSGHYTYDSSAEEAESLRTGTVTRDEAYDILGLGKGASWTEVNRAYRDIMKVVHPDQGGSSYLAAKVNQAKDLLLGEKTGTKH